MGGAAIAQLVVMDDRVTAGCDVLEGVDIIMGAAGATVDDHQRRAAADEIAEIADISGLTASPDGRWLVSGNQDPSVHLWIPETGIELHMSGYETKVKHLSYDHTSRWLATSGGREACIWDCSGDGPEGREPMMLPHNARVVAVAFQHAHACPMPSHR